MKKALIHYFSGTGNTLLAAKQLGEELNSFGYDLTFHPVEKGPFGDLESFSLHIFAFPVYATSVPHIMRKYIHKLPDGNMVKTAVIATNGRISTHYRDGYQGLALHQARLCLKARHYDVFFSDTLDYPHNVTIALPPRNDKANQKIIDETSKTFPEIARKIAENTRYHRKIFFLNFLWSIPFGIGYEIIGRRLFGKLLTVDSSCNSCKLCEKNCPAGVIKAENKRNHWKWNCEGCLRCMNICPKRSIQTSLIRVFMLILAMVANPLYLVYHYIPKEFMNSLGAIGAAIFNTVIGAILFLVFVELMDRLIYMLCAIPVLRNLIGFGHTKFFGRYNAKKFEKIFLKDTKK